MNLSAARIDTRSHSGEFVLYLADTSLAIVAQVAHALCSSLKIEETQEAYTSVHSFLSSQPRDAFIKFVASYETDIKSFFLRFAKGNFVGFVPVPWRACLMFGDVEVLPSQSAAMPLKDVQEHFKLPRLFEPTTAPLKCTPPNSQALNLVCVPTA